jgi:hypothetical protein
MCSGVIGTLEKGQGGNTSRRATVTRDGDMLNVAVLILVRTAKLGCGTLGFRRKVRSRKER